MSRMSLKASAWFVHKNCGLQRIVSFRRALIWSRALMEPIASLKLFCCVGLRLIALNPSIGESPPYTVVFFFTELATLIIDRAERKTAYRKCFRNEFPSFNTAYGKFLSHRSNFEKKNICLDTWYSQFKGFQHIRLFKLLLVEKPCFLARSQKLYISPRSMDENIYLLTSFPLEIYWLS